MAKLFIVDEQGASGVSVTDARARFDEANIDAFGATLDTTSHAPQNQIAGINALVWKEIGDDVLRAALWGASPSYAQGIYLDSLGGLLDIRRELATYTRVDALLTGTSGTTVPAGSLARTEGGDQFQLSMPVVIQPEGTIGSFVALESGPIECAAGALNGVVSVLSGWTGVLNEYEGTIGRNRESDTSYRANILERTAQSSIGAVGALRSALVAAGATDVKIVENTTGNPVTSGGVSVPGNSIFVLAEGGLQDDIGRAIENHRGMGCGTYGAITGRATTLAHVQSITNGRMRWNGTDISGLNFSTDTLSGVATELSAKTGAPAMRAEGDALVAFYSWMPDDEGFEDRGGSPAESVSVIDGFRIKEGSYYTTGGATSVRLVYTENRAGSFSQTRPTITYDQAGSTHTLDTSSSTMQPLGNMIWWSLSPGSIPADATNVKLTPQNSIRNIAGDVAPTTQTIVLNKEELPSSTQAPLQPVVFGVPSTTSVAVWGWAFGTVTKWQYRRYQSGAYLDTDWVDVSGTNDATLGSGATGITISGFTAGLRGSRVDLRAVNGSNGNSLSASVAFDTISTAPSITSASIDGQSIILTSSVDLRADTRSGTLSQWSVSKSGVSVQEQRIRGRTIYLKTNSPVLESDSSLTISYSSPGSGRVTSTTGVNMANASNIALTNSTVSGVPARPAPVLIFKYSATDYKVIWVSNDGGGQTIDRYEYQSSTDNRNSFTAWQPLSTAALEFSRTETVPDAIRVRASTPNARTAEILGLSGLIPSPFMRPIEKPLSVSIEIGSGSSLSGNDLILIKAALVEKVNSYETGSTLRVADLQSEVERLPGVEVSSFAVTSGGSAVDGVAQSTYIRWTLARSDVDISFQ